MDWLLVEEVHKFVCMLLLHCFCKQLQQRLGEFHIFELLQRYNHMG
jgi:hypothetical protein